MKLVSAFQTIEEFDQFIANLKPGQHARISHNGKLIVGPYKKRKHWIGGDRYVIMQYSPRRGETQVTPIMRKEFP